MYDETPDIAKKLSEAEESEGKTPLTEIMDLMVKELEYIRNQIKLLDKRLQRIEDEFQPTLFE